MAAAKAVVAAVEADTTIAATGVAAASNRKLSLRTGADFADFTDISNHSYLVYTIDVSVILSEARRA